MTSKKNASKSTTAATNNTLRRQSSSSLEAAKAFARRTGSRVWQERPQTPAGWTVLASALSATALGYELQLQRDLTQPPLVFLQRENNEVLQPIYERLMKGILGQPVIPGLWIGTRSLLASTLSVVVGTPDSKRCVRFSEVVIMPIDGAKIKLEWEVPLEHTTNTDKEPTIPTKQEFFGQPIDKPVVLIVHGLNNHSGAGYVRSLQRTLTNRGKIAVGFNMRGVGGIQLAAPRGYGGAYTGDLRYVVHYLSSLLAPDTPLLLVGFSLGANLVTKYLGEEGLSGTLPKCVIGGASLGNPLHINSRTNLYFPLSQLMAQGVKLYILEHWNVWKYAFSNPLVREAFQKSLLATNQAEIDEAFSPIHLRNEPYYPFETKIGYECVEDYWEDCSSYRFIQHVSVPLLAIIAGDDQVVYKSFQRKLGHSIQNPNVMCVETKCGGHLGWFESPPPSDNPLEEPFVGRPSWASRATADFIDAVLEERPVRRQPTRQESMHPWEKPPVIQSGPTLQSRL